METSRDQFVLGPAGPPLSDHHMFLLQWVLDQTAGAGHLLANANYAVPVATKLLKCRTSSSGV